MHAVARARVRRPFANLSRSRLLLLLLGAIAAVIMLAACGKVDSSTEIAADGSGVQTLAVTINEQDMERIDGGAATVEAAIEENNPGVTYTGMTKDGTDTVFTMTIEFSDAKDYAAAVQPLLEAGELSRTAEVTLTPPSPPFSTGYTLTRNFTGNDLTRWAVKALVDDGSISDATESDIDDALDPGEVTVAVDGEELEREMYPTDDSATVWSNATEVAFDSVHVVTAGAEDPSADSFTRTLTYELQRATYLDHKDAFDTFFAEATPEGGELTPAGETGTTWVIAFPAGTAEQVGTWTDAALATSGSVFTVETAPNAEDPFQIDTRVVDTIDCTVACGEMGGLSQALEVPVGFTGGAADPSGGTEEVGLDGGTEPQVISRSIVFTEAAYEMVLDRDGGGSLTMTLSLPAADDAVVTEENVIAFLGEGTERAEVEDLVTYTRTAEAEDSAAFSGALQKLGFEGPDGPPQVDVADTGEGSYRVSLALAPDSDLYEKIDGTAEWTIRGDGLRPTALVDDQIGNASLGEEAVTADEAHAVVLTFSAERTGLGTGAIIAIVLVLGMLALLIVVGILAFVFRERLAALLRGSTAGPGEAAPPVVSTPPTGPDQP